MYEDLIPAIATATRIACLRPEARAAAGAADAEIFGLLAETAGDPGVAGVLRLGTSMVRDLAAAAGPLADGIIANSNRRLLAQVRAGDADAAEREMEKLLRCLHVMWRLARSDKRAALMPDAAAPESGGREKTLGTAGTAGRPGPGERARWHARARRAGSSDWHCPALRTTTLPGPW